jgi:hypothetical protein
MKAGDVFKASQALAAALGDEIWPGFDARRYTFLQTDRASGAVQIAFSPNPKEPDRGVFMSAGDDYFRRQTPQENLCFVFHEAFHAFQRDAARPGARWRLENALTLFDYSAAPARNQALFAVEGRILRAALRASDEESVRKKVRQFLAVRQLRQEELGPRLAEFEKGAESNEGLAEYAGTRAVVAGMEAVRHKRVAVPFTSLDASGYLRDKFATLHSLIRIGRNDRLKFYYTGSAQGLLLDRLLPAWKGRVQQKAVAVQDLLAEAVGMPDRGDTEAALKEYDYETAARQAEEEAARRKAEGDMLLGSLQKRKGWRCTLDVTALGRMGDYRGFDPMNVTVLDRMRRLHTRFASFGQEKYYAAEFNQPVLEDRGNQKYFTVVPAGETPTVLLDGRPLAPDSSIRKRIGKKLVVSSPHLRLEAESGEVEVTGTGVVVTIARKPG